MQNVGAANLVKEHDRHQKRTIGTNNLARYSWFGALTSSPVALTKPDLIQDGDRIHWLKTLESSSNWFCVRRPGTKQIKEGISREKAQEQEMKFFQEGEWRDLYNNQTTRTRLGTENLRNYLNTRLFKAIMER